MIVSALIIERKLKVKLKNIKQGAIMSNTITLNTWPNSQECTGCRYALFIFDSVHTPSTYGCSLNKVVTSLPCMYKVEISDEEWERKF